VTGEFGNPPRAAAVVLRRARPAATIPPVNDPHPWESVYPAGVQRAFRPPEQPLWSFLADAARLHADSGAVTFEGRTWTFGELWRDARLAASRLLATGARPGTPGAGPDGAGDRILIVLPNCPEFLAVHQGTVLAGLVAAAAAPHLTPGELAEMVRIVEPRVVVCDASARPGVDAALAEAGVGGTPVLAVEPGLPGEFAGGGVAEAEPFPAAPHDVAVLQFTSGTTGGVKAATMSHGNLVANALQNDLWFGWSDADVVLGALPLCHTWGTCCVMNAGLAARARIALLRRFDPDEVLATIAREGVTVAYGSATMFHRLLDAAGVHGPERFRTLRYVKAGAMLVGGDLVRRWSSAVPAVPMVNGYGLTEASPEVTNNPPQAPRVGTVGVPLPGTEIRLAPVDLTDAGDEDTAARGAGEVQIRGPQVTSGYWRRPDATSRAFTADGWLRTGDLGRFDESGYLVLVDRLKDLIKHRGWSVVPAEVERALREHPAIEEACVVGAPDARDGEVPVAFVVLREGHAAPDDAALSAHLATRLASYKRPRGVLVVEEIPKNHVGKPLRRVLRERIPEGAP